MSDEQRMSGGLPMVARLVEGPIQTAFGWHEGLNQRVKSHICPWPDNPRFVATDFVADPHIVATVGNSVVQMLRIGHAMMTGDVVCIELKS